MDRAVMMCRETLTACCALQNIILDADGSLRLIDLGCVKALKELPVDQRIEALLDAAADGTGESDAHCAEARALTEILQAQHRGVVKKDMQTLGEAAEAASHAEVGATRAILKAKDEEEAVEGLTEPRLRQSGHPELAGKLVAAVKAIRGAWEPLALEVLRGHSEEVSGLVSAVESLKAHDAGPLLAAEAVGALSSYAASVEAALEAIQASTRAGENLRDTSWRLRREYSRGAAHGTTEYMAPELVDSETRGQLAPTTDLWAVGCVCFQMLTEVSPFKGANPWLTAQKVCAHEYKWPEGINTEAREWVDSLLELVPGERLGTQGDGSVDYGAIRAHSFLAGVEVGAPPGIHPNSAVVRVGVGNTAPAAASGAPAVVKDAAAMEWDLKLEEERVRWSSILMPGERIVRSSLLKKRAHIFSTTERRFLLTQIYKEGPQARTLARLIYIDEAKMCYRGEVPWSGEIVTELKDARHFEVTTPRATFQLEDPEGKAAEWIEAIDHLVSLTPKAALRPVGQGADEGCRMFRCF